MLSNIAYILFAVATIAYNLTVALSIDCRCVDLAVTVAPDVYIVLATACFFVLSIDVGLFVSLARAAGIALVIIIVLVALLCALGLDFSTTHVLSSRVAAAFLQVAFLWQCGGEPACDKRVSRVFLFLLCAAIAVAQLAAAALWCALRLVVVLPEWGDVQCAGSLDNYAVLMIAAMLFVWRLFYLSPPTVGLLCVPLVWYIGRFASLCHLWRGGSARTRG